MSPPSLTTSPDRAEPPARRRFLAASAGWLTVSLVAACGGGDSDPPEISLSVIPSSGAVGDTITLSADAEDDDTVTEVRFYRVTSNATELLATYTSAPYLFQTTIPSGSSGTVRYKATAVDNDDQETDSATVTVTVDT